MENDILHRLIEVEKEVQQRLELEKSKSKAWLQKVREDAEREIHALETGLKETLAQEINTAELNAGKKASDILENAHKKSGFLEKIGNGQLKKIILKHISGILPG